MTTAAVVALVLVFLTGTLTYLPRCVLGAVVFTIAIGLISLRQLGAIRKESPGEYALAVFTAVVVVALGVEQGIVLAMAISLLRIVRHGYRPNTAVMEQEPDGAWKLLRATPGTVSEPGIVIYRFGAPLFYANANRFSEEVRALVDGAPQPLRWLVVDAGAITNVDYTAARTVIEVVKELKKRGTGVALVHVQSDLQPDLDRHHITEEIGKDRVFDTLRDALGELKRVDS